MKFEDILADVGDFGHYQVMLLVLFAVPVTFMLPIFGLNYVFMLSIPSHRCLNPALINLTKEQQNLLPHPTQVMYGVEQASQCSSYMFNYTEALFILDVMKTNNNLIDELSKEWTPKPCLHGWDYDTTWFIETVVTKWNLVCDQDYFPGLLMTIIIGGEATGTTVYGMLSDRYGRKRTFFIVTGMVIIFGFTSIAMPDVRAFAVLRPFTDTAMISLYQQVFVIVTELVHPDKRTRVLIISSFAWVSGSCFLPLLAYLTRHWITLGAVSVAGVLPFIGYWWLIPESPRWLLSKKKYGQAEEVLKLIARRNKFPVPTDLMKNLKNVAEEEEESRTKDQVSNLDILRVPVLRKFFLLLNIGWMSCGITYYGLQLNVVNLSGNQFLNFFLLSLVELPAYAVSWYAMEHLGRRWSTVGFFILTSLSGFCAAAISLENSVFDVAMSMVGKLSNSVAFTVIYEQVCELFPTPLRNSGLGITSGICHCFQLLVPYIIYFGLYNRSIPFLIIGSVSLVAAFALMFVPETLGTNLPQTVADCKVINANHKFFSWIRKSTIEKQRNRDTLLKKSTPNTESSIC